MEEPKVRLAGEKDVPAITLLSKECYGEDSYPQSYFVYALRLYASSFFIIENNSRVIGYAAAVIPNNQNDDAWEISFVVSPESQEEIFGRKLLEALIECLKLRGVKKFHVNFHTKNTFYRNLLENAGFKLIGMQKDMMGPGEDRFQMVLNLS